MTARKRILGLLCGLGLLGGLLVVPTVISDVSSASAVSGSEFQPGNIISDQNFFNQDSMSEADIQAFLESKNCKPRDSSPCLEDFSVSTPTVAAVGDGHCAQYSGGANESASRIIWKVAQACRISPAVLLVLLQKEQSLITSPNAYGYARAMGWGCPDSGPGYSANCDANYFGLFNQVYKSAWQFRQYTLYPVAIPGGGTRQYSIGTRSIQYHPNPACGAANVNIQNQATANLYLYTPYIPNAPALQDQYLYGESPDACSSYGNRNFWRIYSDWFGPTTSPLGTPVGEVKDVWTTNNKINMWGWAYDVSIPTDPIAIHVSVNGVWTAWTANAENTTANTLYPGAGTKHGFGGSISVPRAGTYNVCVYAVNQGPGVNLQLGCYNLAVADGSPSGVVNDISAGPGQVSLWGWALDPDVQDPIAIHVNVNGKWTVLTADQPNTSSTVQFPTHSADHGFGGVIPLSGGAYNVCAFAVNVGEGTNTTLGCRDVVVPSGSPVGSVSDVWGTPNGVNLWGWALDPDTTGPIDIHVRVDSDWTVLTADAPNAGIGAAFPAFGPNHGFGGVIPVAPGSHSVCIWGINQGIGANLNLGCRTIVVPSSSPVGVLNDVWGTPSAINMWGWALDPNTIEPISVHVRIDGQWTVVKADAPNAGVASAYPDFGPNHGFSAVIPTTSGRHEVCTWAINVGAGTNLGFGCRIITAS